MGRNVMTLGRPCRSGRASRSAASLVVLLACVVTGCSGNEITAGADAPKETASITKVDRSPLSNVGGGSTSGEDGGFAATASGRRLKIGLVLPLGGFDQTAVIAKGMKQATEMALFEAERADIQLIVKDDKGTAEGAQAATEEAIKEGAEVIIGPLLARAVPGAAAAARPAGIPVLSFSNDRSVAGNGVYTLGFSPEQDADRVVDYATRNGKQRFAVLVPDDGYGRVIGDAFKEAVNRAGGTIAAFESYPAGANAMIGPSRRIVEAAKAGEAAGNPIDAVFLPGGPDVLPQLGPLLTYSGFDAGRVKLLGSGAWDFATIGANEAFVGGWYASPDPQGWRGFQARFAKAFGQVPPRVASIAYDAMGIAIALSRESGDKRFTTANLTRSGGFPGVDGTVRLTASGTAERGLAILEVQKVGTIVAEPAPGSLDGARLSGTPLRVN
jgi:ABC-type branched-subunit amino acid transport system substrate-binding protein